jgi:hypothetical protein
MHDHVLRPLARAGAARLRSKGPGVKCLRTGAIHGLRMVFVDEGPQLFPLLENLHRPRRNTEEPTPTTYRSLSRRQVGVLQMIARGMSNKCIARSLGIAPETVKTRA